MPSIRRSLLGYLLVLLGLALGAVGVFVDRFARNAMWAREEAETRRILHAYQAQEKKALDRFDADLLTEARGLAQAYADDVRQLLGMTRRGQLQGAEPRPEARPEPRPIERIIRAPDEDVQEFRARARVLQLGAATHPFGPARALPLLPTTDGPARVNPAWLGFDAPRVLARIADYLRAEFDADVRAAHGQFDLVVTTPYAPQRTFVKVNPGRLGHDLPFGTAELDALKGTGHAVSDVDVPGRGPYRRVVLTVSSAYPVWVPGTPAAGTVPRPGGPRVPRPPDLTVRTYVQCAHPHAELHARLAPDQKERDDQLAAVRTETRAELTQLRTRLGLIGGGSFVALVLGGWVIVARGLFPLHRLSEAVSQVSEKDFRLPIGREHLGRELAPIHDRLTQTLDLLRRAFAREKQAVADISHELRTPIASLLATLDVALRKPRTPEQYRATLQDCRVICKQLSQLVERIMTLASLDAGTARTVRTPTDVADLAAGCAAVIRPLAESHGLTFAAAVDAPLELDTDPDKLREVLINLLHNAVEYNQPGGRVELAGRRENGAVVLEVRDTGIGMTPDVREKIFERFFRADPSRQATGVHAGLGLAIVQEYVGRLGGSIGVESTPGEGSTFRVTLPAGAAEPAEPPPPPQPAGRPGAAPVRTAS